jgi:hypothetical protein
VPHKFDIGSKYPDDTSFLGKIHLVVKSRSLIAGFLPVTVFFPIVTVRRLKASLCKALQAVKKVLRF